MKVYVLEVKGEPNYRYCGPSIGFMLHGSAIRYFSKKVAKMAAALVQKRRKEYYLRAPSLVVREVES